MRMEASDGGAVCMGIFGDGRADDHPALIEEVVRSLPHFQETRFGAGAGAGNTGFALRGGNRRGRTGQPAGRPRRAAGQCAPR